MPQTDEAIAEAWRKSPHTRNVVMAGQKSAEISSTMIS